MVAISIINFSSSGFANLASTIVHSTPFFESLSDAFLHSSSLVPKFNKATFFPSLIILPFPISKTSFVEGSSTPTPLPRGYLKAEGRSFILTEVLIIFTSSASSLAAITTKLGKVDK